MQKSLAVWRNHYSFSQYCKVDPQCKIIMGNIFAFLNHLKQQWLHSGAPTEDDDYRISRGFLVEEPSKLDVILLDHLQLQRVKIEDDKDLSFPTEFLTPSSKSLAYNHIKDISFDRALVIEKYLVSKEFSGILKELDIIQNRFDSDCLERSHKGEVRPDQ